MFVLLIGLTVLGTVASGVSLLYAWHMRKALDRTLTENLWKVIATADLDIALQRQKGLVASYLLDRGKGNWLEDLPRHDAEFRLTIDKMLKECTSTAECAMLRDIEGAYDDYDRIRDQVVALYEEGKRNEATDLYLQQIGAQYARVADLADRNVFYVNQKSKGEPQLGRRGIYSSMGGHKKSKEIEMAILWILNYSDGNHSLLQIAQKSNISFDAIHQAAQLLLGKDLIISV